eukprot:Plantae.Rhodophyta-Palmaria_palmata.ctg3973.p1 GENE.Plantae.Rhodophyta-Palmaria_palmata.ctg3973~~Plantae.Rhodophyta-Palmaria_palmata.ctg3973.p1  ORF type:complete len:244 (-),score=30.93 Plantae.Rhodophyta-Palmaria_palmata.ctg3973:222-905(-)
MVNVDSFGTQGNESMFISSQFDGTNNSGNGSRSSSGELGSQGAAQGALGRQRNDGASACFPAEATVTLLSGESVRMEQLKVGDVVETGFGQFSSVFIFTHADAEIKMDFLTMTTDSKRSIALTAGHFLYVSGELRAAKEARVGDTLTLHDGSQSTVISIARGKREGLYNPQTVHGNVVVDGVVTSTYTTAVRPLLAHSLLAPLRAAFKLGIPTELFNMPLGGGQWFM